MEFTESQTEQIPVQLENGAVIKIEVSKLGQEDVGFGVKPFREVTDALEGIVQAISETLQKVNSDKASVKFGMELAILFFEGLAAVRTDKWGYIRNPNRK